MHAAIITLRDNTIVALNIARLQHLICKELFAILVITDSIIFKCSTLSDIFIPLLIQ